MAWLPPLNLHDECVVLVDAREYPTPNFSHNLRLPGYEIVRTFLLSLDVRINFFSESDPDFRKSLPGLHVSKVKSINVEKLHASICNNFFNDSELLPFSIHLSHWKARCLHRTRCFEEFLYTKDNLLNKLIEFVKFIDNKVENQDANLLAVKVDITKGVVVPDDEFDEWIQWYEEARQMNPIFEMEYRRAIRKPRDRFEMHAEVMSMMSRHAKSVSIAEFKAVFMKDCDGLLSPSCRICFTDFEDKMNVAKLPCRHVFHEHCMSRWLRDHDACPLCRKRLRSN